MLKKHALYLFLLLMLTTTSWAQSIQEQTGVLSLKSSAKEYLIKRLINQNIQKFANENFVFPGEKFIISEGPERRGPNTLSNFIQDYIVNKLYNLERFDIVGHDSIPIAVVHQNFYSIKIEPHFYENLESQAEKLGASKAFLWNIHDINGTLSFVSSIVDISTKKVLWTEVTTQKNLDDAIGLSLIEKKKAEMSKDIMKMILANSLDRIDNKVRDNIENNITYHINKNLDKNISLIRQNLDKNISLIKQNLDKNISMMSELDKKKRALFKQNTKLDINQRFSRIEKEVQIALDNNLTQLNTLVKNNIDTEIEKRLEILYPKLRQQIYDDLKTKVKINNGLQSEYYFSVGMNEYYNFLSSNNNEQALMLGMDLSAGIISGNGNSHYGVDFSFSKGVTHNQTNGNSIYALSALLNYGVGEPDKTHFGGRLGLEIKARSNKQILTVVEPYYALGITKGWLLEAALPLKYGFVKNTNQTQYATNLELGLKLTLKYTLTTE